MRPDAALQAKRLERYPWTSAAEGQARCGEALAVGVDAEGTSAVALFAVRVGEPSPRSPEDAYVALHPALVAEAERLRGPAWRACPRALRLDGAPKVAFDLIWRAECSLGGLAQGRSYGLAIALATASWWAATPLRLDVLALAAVDGEGRLERVDGIAAKIACVLQLAPRLRAVLVAPDNEAAARRALLDRPEIEVLTRATLEEAVHFALPAAPPELPRPAARALVRCVHAGRPPLPDWRPIAGGLRACLEHSPAPDAGLAPALAVVERHLGRASESLLLDPALRVDAELASQALQQARDGGGPGLAPLVDEALAILPPHPRDRQVGHLKLLGAAGRALAALGDLASARRALAEALEGWATRGLVAESTISRCEALRLAALVGDVDDFDAQAADWAEVMDDPELNEADRAFVGLSVGLGQCLLGRPLASRAALAQVMRAEAAHTHVRVSAGRWLRRAGAAELPRLPRLEAPLTHTWDRLAELDAALALGAEPAIEAAGAALTADPFAGRYVPRLLATCPEGVAPWAWVADAFPY